MTSDSPGVARGRFEMERVSLKIESVLKLTEVEGGKYGGVARGLVIMLL